MNRSKISTILLLGLLAFNCSAGSDNINGDLVVSKVLKTVDLSSQLPKVSSSITLENTGKTTVNYFIYAVDPSLASQLAFVGALVKGTEEDTKLAVKPTTLSGQSGTFFRVDLPSALGAGKDTTVEVEATFTHCLKPYPSKITQAEKQFVEFAGNSHFYSPYKTSTLTTIVNCASSTIESYTKTKPVSASESTITYGPYENLPAFSQSAMDVHYENNAPFLTVTDLDRTIEVSHWGNIAVEETVDVLHTGAELKGTFSRYDFQRQAEGFPFVKSFKTVLPSSAADVYYRDEIGNISTSNLRDMDESVELELRPRFPLFGGWKTHYLIGYNVPSYQYLFNSGDKYVLKARFIDHVFDDMVVDNAVVRIILPEGAQGIKLKTPYPVTEDKTDRHFTYLDTIGRPVIVARKSNLVEGHIQDFELHYTYSKYMLLQEPLLVIGVFYLLFVVIIIYVRMDFSITKDEASESRMRVASLIEQVQANQDRRSALYQSYEDAINKYKSSKDSPSFVANRKKVDADHKQLTQQIAGLQSKLKSEGSDVSDKVAQLQKLDTDVREVINTGITQAERLISGKMSKQQYVDVESTVKTKKEDLYQKMEALLSSM